MKKHGGLVCCCYCGVLFPSEIDWTSIRQQQGKIDWSRNRTPDSFNENKPREIWEGRFAIVWMVFVLFVLFFKHSVKSCPPRAVSAVGTKVLFLWSSWSGVCGFAFCCLLACRYFTLQAGSMRLVGFSGSKKGSRSKAGVLRLGHVQGLFEPLGHSKALLWLFEMRRLTIAPQLFVSGSSGSKGLHPVQQSPMSLAGCCVMKREDAKEEKDADTALGLLSDFRQKHHDLAKMVQEEEDMLLTLSYYLERVRLDFPQTPKNEGSPIARASTESIREVQFSKRVSEISQKTEGLQGTPDLSQGPSQGLKGVETTDGTETLDRPTRSRPIPAPLYLTNFPPSPIKSRSRAPRAQGASKSSRPSNFPSETVNNMYSINGIGDYPTNVRTSFVDAVRSLHSNLKTQSIFGRMLAPIILWMSTMLDRLYASREPERTGCLARFVKSQLFGTMSTIVILANAVFIMFATDYEMENLTEATPQVIRVIDVVLASFYVLEVSLKILTHRLYFFWNNDAGWNCFDFCLVVFSILENLLAYDVIPSETTSESDPMNFGFLRLLRLCKIVKILRIFRTLRVFGELRLMLDCVFAETLKKKALFVLSFDKCH